MDTDGSNLQNLTNTASQNESRHSFSNNGKKIAYVVNQDAIYIMDADGSNKKQLQSMGTLPNFLRMTLV